MDDFSDDGFDDLNDTVLQELEDNAIQFTQAAQHVNTTQQANYPSQAENYDLEFDGDDLDDTIVFDELAPPLAKPIQQTRVAPVGANRPQWNQPTAGPPPRPHTTALSSRPRYPGPSQPGAAGAPSTHAIGQSAGNRTVPFQRPPPPRPIPPARVAPPSTFRPTQYGGPPHPPNRLQPGGHLPPPTHAAGGPPPSQQNDIITALQARLSSLQKDLTTAKGEAALLRNKYQDSISAHDAEVARLKKLNAEQLAKQERVAEQAIAAEKTAATELHFAKQELRDERGRARKGGRNQKENEGLRLSEPAVQRGSGSGATTPKKGGGAGGSFGPLGGKSNWAVADGFDEIELISSPSKAGTRRGKEAGAVPPVLPGAVERTPTKAKRKRPAVDSPLLELETDDVVMGGTQPPFSVRDGSGGAKFRTNALPFDFLTMVLDHSALHSQPLTFDLFARYSFPSDPSLSFASHIFSKLHSLGSPHDPFRLLTDFCHLIIEMWAQCLHERYYRPIYDLVALVAFTLQLQTMAVAPRIISYLLPIAQATIDLLAIPAFKSVDGDLSAIPDPALQQLLADINTTSILSVIHLTALGCLSPSSTGTSPGEHEEDSPQVQFWSTVEPEFIVTILSPKQRPDDFLGVLCLLRTSVLPTSVGPITRNDPARDVDAVAAVLVDRISYYLADPPRWAPPGSQRQCEAKMEALETLAAFARSPFGLTKLVVSDHAIPRLVAALCAAVDMLYDMEIPATYLSSSPSASQRPGQQEPQLDPNLTQDLPDPTTVDDLLGSQSTAARRNYSQPPDPDVRRPSPQLLHTLIKSSVLLLHKLVTTASTGNGGVEGPANGNNNAGNGAGGGINTSVPAKLAASHGGAQRYLLTLARLNFADEDFVLEAGIDAETAELANELLELAVTPDEGEGVRDVFNFDDH